MSKGVWRFSGVAVLLFVGCYWLGKKTSSISHATHSPVINPIAKPSALEKTVGSRKNLQAEIVTAKAPEPKISARSWDNLHGGELYSALFDQKTFSNLGPQDFEKLQEFFFKPYPALETLYKSALIERLGVLKALEQQQSLPRAPSSVMLLGLHGFYIQVLDNSEENWLVKRQVFKNLQPALSQQEKENYYRSLSSRIISLSSKSEQEIVEEALRELR